MSRISVIALSQLPSMEVIETIDTEQVLADRMEKLVEYWIENDPPVAAVYDVDALEFDPIKINQEASTYFELMLRDRVNQAARSVTLAFASGGDLDAIASRYPGGVPRLTNETDDRYRRRIWLASNLTSPHGVFEAYVFWALTADATLHDATAITTPGTGIINVTIMAEGDDPQPTDTQLNTVLTYIKEESRKGLTDVVQVSGPTVTEIIYDVQVWLYPGFDQQTVMDKLDEAMQDLIEKQYWLGYDHTLMAANAALAIDGVYNVVINYPTIDTIVSDSGLVVVQDYTLTYQGRGE